MSTELVEAVRAIRNGEWTPYEDDYAKDIPPTTKAGIDRYVLRGAAPGGFLADVLSHDFRAICSADTDNLTAIKYIAWYMYNRIPRHCHGSREAVRDWLDTHTQAQQEAAEPCIRSTGI